MQLGARLLAVALVGSSWLSATAAEFDASHTAFDRVLKQRVHDGAVDYAGLKADPAPLAAYLDQLARVSEDDFEGWSDQAQLAFLINLYNATTLQLIVEHYPLKSIRSIGWLPGSAWKQQVVRLFGRTISLDDLEHGMIRPDYHEPRAHFALVCGARGCPPLRGEAFVGDRLGAQLEEQGRIFFRQSQKNRIDPTARVIYLSPIFKWFHEDFEGRAGSVVKFVAPYFPETIGPASDIGTFEIRYTDYDWSLNDQAPRR